MGLLFFYLARSTKKWHLRPACSSPYSPRPGSQSTRYPGTPGMLNHADFINTFYMFYGQFNVELNCVVTDGNTVLQFFMTMIHEQLILALGSARWARVMCESWTFLPQWPHTFANIFQHIKFFFFKKTQLPTPNWPKKTHWFLHVFTCFYTN